MAKLLEAQTTQHREDIGFTAINLASLRVDTVTSFDIYFQHGPNQPFVLYAERNVTFTEQARQRLVENKIDKVYIRANQVQAYGRYIEDHLPALLTDSRISTEEKTEMLYTSATGVAEALLRDGLVQDGVRRSKDVVKHAVNFMLSDKHVFAALLKAISTDYRVYSHSVNVMTYVIGLAHRLGQHDSATLRELAVGALLHDIGKGKIDPAIVNCSRTLTQDQWDTMKRHSTYGHEMLATTGAFGEIALDIVLHHHEKVRGGGYPDNLQGEQISRFVRLVSIADIFDALTTDRPFQQKRTSFTALSLMRTQIARDLDPELFRVFVTMMGNPGS
jgi:putative nucleotidyltransferase with HDIG domain